MNTNRLYSYEDFINERMINENFLKNVWNKIVEFFSSDVKNVIRKVKSTDDDKEKEKILDEGIESLAKEYIKIAKKDSGDTFYLMELSSDIFKLLSLYKKVTGTKHIRDTWRSEYLGGYFVWVELLDIKSKDDLESYFKNRIKNLEESKKKELEKIKKHREEFIDFLDKVDKKDLSD